MCPMSQEGSRSLLSLLFFFLFSSSSFPSFLIPDTGSVHGRVRFLGRCVAFLETWAFYVCAHGHTHPCTNTPTPKHTQVISVSTPKTLAPKPVPGAVTQVGSFWDGESWEGGNYLQVLMGKPRHGAGTCGPHPHCGYESSHH